MKRILLCLTVMFIFACAGRSENELPTLNYTPTDLKNDPRQNVTCYLIRGDVWGDERLYFTLDCGDIIVQHTWTDELIASFNGKYGYVEQVYCDAEYARERMNGRRLTVDQFGAIYLK